MTQAAINDPATNSNATTEQPKAVKMIKMKAIEPCRIVRPTLWNGKMIDAETVIPAGKTFEATEEEAKDFEKNLEQHHSYVGQRHKGDGDIKRHSIQRAKRV